MNNSILQKIGVTNKDIEFWLKKGLQISYPMFKNKQYYKSEDGFVFIENADKYVIPLSDKEIKIYTKNPKLFKRDFLKNVKFYVKFINWLHALQLKASSLAHHKEKFIAFLTILYLFQRSMDYHYYHFDRYLAYQNYPDTPVGYWWKELKEICRIIAKKEKLDKNTVLLHLLSKDNESEKIEATISPKEKQKLIKIIEQIRVFEKAQEDEIKKIIDFKTKENILFRTAMPIWEELTKTLKNNPNLIKQDFRKKIFGLLEKNPLIATRLILCPEGLICFTENILKSFENEIKMWL